MSPEVNIILAGPMGSGKTTVGMIVAEKLGREFWDIDHMIEEKTGMSITRIFSERSESYFRMLEREIVKTITQKKNLVVAVGGGMTIPKENLSDLSGNGLIICLCASIGTLTNRLYESRCRPLLMGDNLEERISEILQERNPAYSKIELQLATDELSVETAANKVIEIFREQTANV